MSTYRLIPGSDGATYVYRRDTYIGTITPDERHGGWRIVGEARWFTSIQAAARVVWVNWQRR